MKLNQLETQLPYFYAAQRCLYVRSRPGRGKTTTISAAPAKIGAMLKKNLGFVLINGPLLTPSDSVGYLVPQHMPDGRAESKYTDPFWFRTSEGKRLDEYDGGIILVDEADKMDTDVKKVIGEAALSGRLGPHKLPPGWVVWMAGNHADDRSGSTKELDHLINRRIEIDLTDDLASLIEWMDANGVTPICKAFTAQNPQIVLPDKPPEKQGPFCTPRSTVGLDSYLQTVQNMTGMKEFPDDPVTVEIAAGMVGPGAASQFFAFVKLDREMPKYESIIKDPKGVKVPVKPDAQMLTCYNLAARVDVTDIAPIVTYIDRLPKDFAVTFASAACKRNIKLVSTPAMQKWALQNSSLMAAISK